MCWKFALSLHRLIAVAIFFSASFSYQAAIATTTDTVLYRADFGAEPGLSIVNWLQKRQFELQHDAEDEHKIRLSQTEESLHIVARNSAFGLIIHEQDVLGAGRVKLHWGVSQYPEGASYEHGVDDEAIMLYVFFGHEKFPSGSLFVPDSPYFLGFFLCKDGADELEKPYPGHHYRKAGRYICVDHPGSNETVVTEIDLAEEFRKSFGLAHVPAVSGISIEIDTTESENDGKAAAFVKRIEFLE